MASDSRPLIDPSSSDDNRASARVAGEVIADSIRAAVGTGLASSLAKHLGAVDPAGGPWVLHADGHVYRLADTHAGWVAAQVDGAEIVCDSTTEEVEHVRLPLDAGEGYPPAYMALDLIERLRPDSSPFVPSPAFFLTAREDHEVGLASVDLGRVGPVLVNGPELRTLREFLIAVDRSDLAEQITSLLGDAGG